MLGWTYNQSSPFLIESIANPTNLQNISKCFCGGSQEKISLRLYVTRDPNHTGKARYTGYLDVLLGSFFFRFDNQNVSADALRLISKTWAATFQRFQVWAPSGGTSPPVVLNPR